MSSKQQTLTDFFAAKKNAKPPAKQVSEAALQKLRKLSSDLEDIQAAKKARLTTKERRPAYERYRPLLSQKPSDVPARETTSARPSSSTSSPLSRIEAKRAALKAAREKLKQVKKDEAALKEFQAAKLPRKEVERPAYEKYHYLTVPSGVLPLPLRYQRLMDDFSSCDTVVSVFHNRREICRLDKLSAAVSKMTKRDFGISRLAKILNLFPGAYSVNVEQHRFLDSKQKFHHILSFTDAPVGHSPTFILKRRQEFKEKLLLRTCQYHAEFLDSLDSEIKLPMEALKRWHPKFKLDSIPDIREISLPKLPDSCVVVNAAQLLSQVRGKFSERIEKALESISLPSRETEKTIAKSTGVNSSLLERIRRKEALKMAEDMVMSSQDENERRILEAIPDQIRTIRQLFLAQQKAAIPYTELVKRLHDSQGSLTSEEITVYLNKLSEIMPDWFKVLMVRNVKYVKIDKNKDVNGLCERVANKVNQSASH